MMIPAKPDKDFTPEEMVINLEAQNEQLQKDKAELVEKYNELIMQVANKIPDETRHETALRYIKQAEKSDDKCTANITL